MPVDSAPTCLLSDLVGRPVTTSSGATVGAVHDVVMRFRERRRPVVSGILARTPDGATLFSSNVFAVMSLARVALRRTAIGTVDFTLDDDEVLLREDVLGRWFTERATADLVRARDLELSATDEGWVFSGIYTHPPRRFGITRRARVQDFRCWTALTDLGSTSRRSPIGVAPARHPVRPSTRCAAGDFAELLESVRSGARADTAAAARALTHLRRRAAAPW
jgi:hypothetical protein